MYDLYEYISECAVATTFRMYHIVHRLIVALFNFDRRGQCCDMKSLLPHFPTNKYNRAFPTHHLTLRPFSSLTSILPRSINPHLETSDAYTASSMECEV